MSFVKSDAARPAFSRASSTFVNGLANGHPAPPVSSSNLDGGEVLPVSGNAVLELSDGSAFQGISFGSTDKSIAGECVFQTGALGYFYALLLKLIYLQGWSDTPSL